MTNHAKQTRVNSYSGLTAALGETAGGPAEILLEAGEYYIEKPIVLGKEHSNLTLRGVEGPGLVRFIGGKRIGSWRKVQDPAVRERFDPAVRDRIYEADLRSQGISDYGRFLSRGFARDMKPSHAEVFLDGKPLNISQYPRKGEFLTITGLSDKTRINECEDEVGIEEYGFSYSDGRPASWVPSGDLCVHGYWCWDWANSCEQVKELDIKKRHVLTSPSYAVTDFALGQRFYFFNILEEVRYPGDYYIDRAAGKLYFYPGEISEGSELLISMLEEPVLTADGADNVTIDNIGFECTRGIGLSVTNTRGFTLDSGEFKHIGNCGVKVAKSWNFTLKNNDIHHTGDGGFVITGGDRMTLRSCEGRVHNNHIYRIATWSRCYCTAINASAVGLSITHNLIHDCPHIGILWGGN
ncbi:MAG: right-handed parallel beta-helix repeat-containing protein, partial [Treponema sp.]|nr:right-handed parallel beta-helix repeat-containing protein [Treponema sp.]